MEIIFPLLMITCEGPRTQRLVGLVGQLIRHLCTPLNRCNCPVLTTKSYQKLPYQLVFARQILIK